jgi:hypothetical protein
LSASCRRFTGRWSHTLASRPPPACFRILSSFFHITQSFGYEIAPPSNGLRVLPPRFPRQKEFMKPAVAFAAGFATAAATCGAVWLANRRSSRRSQIKCDRKNRSERFSSITRALSMTDTDTTRTMVAIAEGESLEIVHIEEQLLECLGYTRADSPRTVYDLMPRSMAPHHLRWVNQVIQANELPARLKHPLRNIDVRHRGGFFLQMDVLIDWMTEAERPCFQLAFVSRGSCAERQLTGVQVGRSVEHEDAIVMLLDIMEFTKTCSQMTATEVPVSIPLP